MLKLALLVSALLVSGLSANAQTVPTKSDVSVHVVATALEYVPRTTTVSHPGHSYTDCQGNTSYFGEFNSLGDFGTMSGNATTNTHCSTTFSPPSESVRTTYRRVNYTLVKDANTLYLLSCTQEWRLSKKAGLLIAAIGGSEAVDKAEADGRGHWTDCPVFSVGAEYTLTVRSASDARLANAAVRKPAKLEYLGAAPMPTAPSQEAASTAQTRVADKPTTVIVHVSSSPTSGEIYVDGKFFGNTPSDITLAAGDHVVRVAIGGKEWTRTLQVTGGEIRLHANLDAQ